MAELAVELLRMIVRSYYQTEHILVIDALCFHSTLSDQDLSSAVSMNVKPLRKVAGRLKEDGLISTQVRQERRTDGSGGYFAGSHGQAGKERSTNREWYYINFHRAIDAVKYRFYKLSKHVESLGAPTTERKELSCPRCKSQYTFLDVGDNVDITTGQHLCHKCGHVLDMVEDDEGGNENEHMRRLNSQVEPFLSLMQRIDNTTVPENDFSAALAKHVPIRRDNTLNPAPRTEIVDVPNRNLASTKGLELKPERISVQLQDDDEVKKESEAEESKRRREKEARQNALPEWISKSTVTGDITTIGAREEGRRREREAHTGETPRPDDVDEDRKTVSAADEDLMKEYWAELRAQEAAQAQQDEDEDEDEEDEDDDENDFEDVGVAGSNTPAQGNTVSFAASTNGTASALDSSNATDDEREAKRPRLGSQSANGAAQGSSTQSAASNGGVAGGSAEQSDEDEDLEFENV